MAMSKSDLPLSWRRHKSCWTLPPASHSLAFPFGTSYPTGTPNSKRPAIVGKDGTIEATWTTTASGWQDW